MAGWPGVKLMAASEAELGANLLAQSFSLSPSFALPSSSTHTPIPCPPYSRRRASLDTLIYPIPTILARLSCLTEVSASHTITHRDFITD